MRYMGVTVPTPEAKARQEIDRQLAACGWLVQDHKSTHNSSSMAAQAWCMLTLLRCSRRLARRGREMTYKQHAEVEKIAGKPLEKLVTDLLTSIDPDMNAGRAVLKFGLLARTDPDEKQLNTVEQVIDEVTKVNLRTSEFDAAARAKAQSVLADFRKFVADNKDEIEAIKLLYSNPTRTLPILRCHWSGWLDR